MRGVFSAGVLDVFLENAFDPFDLAIGVSAGACNLASHLAGQHGRNRRSYCELMVRREFIDPMRALRGRSVVDLDWLWTTLAEREPLNVSAIAQRSTEFLVVATSVATGRPVYLKPAPDDMFDVLKVSCALPLLYRERVLIGRESYIDGGVSDPIPVQEAYRRGARTILVVRSRPQTFIKTHGWSARLTAFLLRKEPQVALAVRRTAEHYQRAVEFLHNPPDDCRIVHVAPKQALSTRRTTQNAVSLERDYALGRAAAEEAMHGWPVR